MLEYEISVVRRNQGESTAGLFFSMWALIDWAIVALGLTGIVLRALVYKESLDVMASLSRETYV